MSDDVKELATLTALIGESGHPAEWPWTLLATDSGISKHEPTFRLAIRGQLRPGPGLWKTELTLPVVALGDGWRDWDGYRFQLFGLLRHLDFEGLSFPVPSVTPPGGPLLRVNRSADGPPQLDIQLWRQFAWRSKQPRVVTDLRWWPWLPEPQDTLLWRVPADTAIRLDEYRAAEEARRLIRRLPSSLSDRGRPRRYSAANEPEFFNGLNKAAHDAVRDGEQVNYTTLAKYHLASKPTIKEAIESLGYDLDAIYAEAVRCTSRANICTFIWRDRAKFKRKGA